MRRWTRFLTGIFVSALPAMAQTASETVLHNFKSPPRGVNPYTGVVLDAAGNLYGTTELGGDTNQGVVYKVDPAGHETVLLNFSGANGANPYGGVTLDAAGNLYGTTYNGGPNNAGVLFKLDTAGQETVLHYFGTAHGAAHPAAGVTLDSAGNLYGTTEDGSNFSGVVFKVAPAGQFTVLSNFTERPSLNAPVVLDSAGNIYGTINGTYRGAMDGAVFKLSPTGQETVLYTFTGKADGSNPNSIALDSAGNLYGTTQYGGSANGPTGKGVVFKVDPSGHETVLYTFQGGNDGGNPLAGVVLDSAGNLYGTTSAGGANGYGVVFKLDSTGHETVLHSFAGGTDGVNPYAGVVLDSTGNLYGTTYSGGAAMAGIVYKLDAAGHETVLDSFTGGKDGAYPYAGVVLDGADTLYGSTHQGGPANVGVIYKIDVTGHETVLHTFSGPDGAYPSGVSLDPAGNLYGTTEQGGAYGLGAVFKLDTTGRLTLLYSFMGGADGANPAGVVLGSTGALYGTAAGGTTPYGVIFKVDQAGVETVQYTFNGIDGSGPIGVTLDSAGNLYGTAYQGGPYGVGLVFKLDTAGRETTLYSFGQPGQLTGSNPSSGLTVDSVGNLYGTTSFGGMSGNGVVYRLDPTGNETVLYNFPGLGSNSSGVVLDSAGNLYGTIENGGAVNVGMVYKLDTTGTLITLYSFNGGAGGGTPYSAPTFDRAGNLYGTAESGGKGTVGIVYKLLLTPQFN